MTETDQILDHLCVRRDNRKDNFDSPIYTQWMIDVKDGMLRVDRLEDEYSWAAFTSTGAYGITGPRLDGFELFEALADLFPDLVPKLAEPIE